MSSSGSAQFQPMPKRFMVWLVDTKCWGTWYEMRIGQVMDLNQLAVFLADWSATLKDGRSAEDELVVVQSTYLFGKDNKEIFEGSIVENDDGDRGVIVYRCGAFEIQWVEPLYECYSLDEVVTTAYKVIGHILSNPELLEEEQ